MSKYLGVVWLGHMVSIYKTVFLNCTIVPFLPALNHFSIPTSSIWEVQLLHNLSNNWYEQSFSLDIPVCLKWYLKILICFSFMTYNVEHHFMCLFAIHISAKVSVYSNLPIFSTLGCLFCLESLRILYIIWDYIYDFKYFL